MRDLAWQPAFDGQRPPFDEANTASLRHGAYSTVQIGPRATELAAEITDSMPLYSPADTPAVRLLAVALARVERAVAALDEVDDALGDRKLAAFMADGQDRLDRLRRDLRSWIGVSAKLMADLGLTPASRVRLGTDLMLAQRASDQALDRLAAEGREIREKRTT
jgi:hypothetical protein